MKGGFGAYVRTKGERRAAFFGTNPLGLEMGPWGRGELERALMVAAEFHTKLKEVRAGLVCMMNKQGYCNSIQVR